MSLAWHTRKNITVDLLERLVFSELSEVDAKHFFTQLSNDAPVRFAAKSMALWTASKKFSLPQPGLTRARREFEIFETNDAVKSLSPSFSKRILLQKRLIGPITHPASVPFGFRSTDTQQPNKASSWRE